MDDNKYSSAIKKAAQWWIDNSLLIDQKLNSQQIKDFTEKLSKSLEKKLKILGVFSFGVDFNPSLILADAIKKAGIKNLTLPRKTRMCVTHNKVSVSSGYGKKPKTIFEK